MKTITQIFLAIAAILTLYSCNKINTTMSINPEIVKRFSFQPGTYWIYKDSVSGQVDSVVVSENKRGEYQSSDDKYYDLEITAVRYTYGQVIDSGFYIVWKLSASTAEITVTGLTSQGPDVSGGISYPLKATAGNNIIDQMFVAGNNYFDVAQLKTSHHDYTNSSSCIYAVANTGIIKMQLTDFPGSPVWELQRCNVVIK